MAIPGFPRRRFLIGAAACCLAGCEPAADSAAQDDIRDLLVGTWLREYEDGGVRVRRVLALDAAGHFRESSRIVQPGANEIESEHAGDWLYDGTNLKRHYTMMDGRPPSAPTIPFATFELQFPTRNEFTGIDRVRRLEVTYRRVDDGTRP
ncbi:hypothetical protein [Caenimonas aquaedulcis]|uniref:Uncharacterized protein n=1 Tax=Caenimonas aquaedulcis TaxID=2793270 RepID=A0A931H1D0_9BURK|nr:hypothetical protein [Caenimonas aquaedulcis]MBG9386684.1 hypothetical protein [Caenimonas aquaedulcis]